MANRELYFVDENNQVRILKIEFVWFPGFSINQKQKSIKSLHLKATDAINIPFDEIIEISTKSKNNLGKSLSAFNLKTATLFENTQFSVESAFQSSKVFEKGGPYTEIINFDSRSAKKDPRLKNSGNLLYFIFYGNRFELSTGTAFYDWLYINVLLKNPILCEQIMKFSAFTDIEFNSAKSMNTQAFSIALFVALKRADIDMSDFKRPEVFLKKTKNFYR